MAISPYSLLTLAALTSHLTQAVPTYSPHDDTPSFAWDKVEHVITFGNSYTYVQGTAGHQNYSFIGDYLPGNFTFSPDKLLSNKIIADYTGTSAGGPNWIEFLTDCGVEPGVYSPSTCNKKRGHGHRRQRELWDFAFAGANYAEQFLPLHHDYTVPMVNQTQQYLSYAHQTLSPRFRHPDRSDVLVAVWIGINDINDIKLAPTPGLSQDEQLKLYSEKYDAINAALFEQSIVPLHKQAGFRNFLFMNIPPYDRAPGNLPLPADSRHPTKEMVDLWNRSLARQVAAFQKTPTSGGGGHGKDKVTALLYDANAFLNGILDDPLRHGFTNTTSPCAAAKGNPDVAVHPGKYGCLPLEEYFWFDAGHM
ncbi:hypothetical protein Micbo1qcDRAFT_214807 [Microdochium bolleyi]|uniref:Lysophospholipase A n=1 Tax=Microdochium bolleyi TaxID=196109 RepID=A0A136ITP9_9PEZI|nr:hypothetical protein Micbo1qcDRAFT_214807 [Microdochium bolleyi]